MYIADVGQHNASHRTGCGQLIILDLHGQGVLGRIPGILYPRCSCLWFPYYCLNATSPRLKPSTASKYQIQSTCFRNFTLANWHPQHYCTPLHDPIHDQISFLN